MLSRRCSHKQMVSAKRLSVVTETDRLFGTGSRSSSWNDLRRHLSFAKGCDIHDIVTKDWPVVRHEIARMGYDETEPLPVAVADLDDLTVAKPSVRVATALNWTALDDETFERLIFCLISDAPGYENPAWLTRTRAPDRGRDLSVTRVRQRSAMYLSMFGAATGSSNRVEY